MIPLLPPPLTLNCTQMQLAPLGSGGILMGNGSKGTGRLTSLSTRRRGLALNGKNFSLLLSLAPSGTPILRVNAFNFGATMKALWLLSSFRSLVLGLLSTVYLHSRNSLAFCCSQNGSCVRELYLVFCCCLGGCIACICGG